MDELRSIVLQVSSTLKNQTAENEANFKQLSDTVHRNLDVHQQQQNDKIELLADTTRRLSTSVQLLHSPAAPLSPSLPVFSEVELSPLPPKSVVPASRPAWEADWDRYIEESSGFPYYVHKVTGETTWDEPAPAAVVVTNPLAARAVSLVHTGAVNDYATLED